MPVRDAVLTQFLERRNGGAGGLRRTGPGGRQTWRHRLHEPGLPRRALFGYPILVAGIGHQGGPVGEVVRAGLHQGRGLIISSSRAITDAVPGPGFARAARAAAQALIDQIYDAVTTLGPR